MLGHACARKISMEQDRSIDRSMENTRHASIIFGRKVKSRDLLSFPVNQRSFVILGGRLGKPHNYRHHRALHTGNRYVYQVVYYVERMRACHWLVHTAKQCFIAWAHSLRTDRSFPLFLGRPVCQLLCRTDVEICTGEKRTFGKCFTKQNLFKFLHVIRSSNTFNVVCWKLNMRVQIIAWTTSQVHYSNCKRIHFIEAIESHIEST